MIEKIFTEPESEHHLAYALACGFSFEKFISGKGPYGNRVSLMRPKNPTKIFNEDADFKDSDFHQIEGIRALENKQTILLTRQKLEQPFTDKPSFTDLISKFEFLNEEDRNLLIDDWYTNVGKKLLGNNKETKFQKLNNFLLGQMILKLPINIQQKIASFRKVQLMDLLTRDILSADFVSKQLNFMPADQDKLVDLKKKLINQRNEYNKKFKIEEAKRKIYPGIRLHS